MFLKVGPDDGHEDDRDSAPRGVRDAAAEQRGDDQRGLALGGARFEINPTRLVSSGPRGSWDAPHL